MFAPPRGCETVSQSVSVVDNTGSETLATNENSQFPRLTEAAHFHYEETKLQSIFLTTKLISPSLSKADTLIFEIGVFSGHAAWNLKKTLYEIFILDHQLHVCLLDRSFSKLLELNKITGPIVEIVSLTCS